MLERNGFSLISKWIYYGTDRKVKKRTTQARIATRRDVNAAWQYLQNSRTYGLCAGRYVSSWRWCPLDKKALRRLVLAGRVVVTGAQIRGVAVLNKAGYWDRPDILQVSYLDAADAQSLQEILAFASNLYMRGYSALHVLCHNSKEMASAVEKFRMTESEVFLLYGKKVFTQ